MTQSQAAEAIGITQTGISDFETSDRGLELLVVRDLVRVYGGDWLAFMAELEKRFKAGTQPAHCYESHQALPANPRNRVQE
jgi:hypothetical protein